MCGNLRTAGKTLVCCRLLRSRRVHAARLRGPARRVPLHRARIYHAVNHPQRDRRPPFAGIDGAILRGEVGRAIPIAQADAERRVPPRVGQHVLGRLHRLRRDAPALLLGARLGDAPPDRRHVLCEWRRVLLLSHDGLALMGPHGRQFDALPRLGRRHDRLPASAPHPRGSGGVAAEHRERRGRSAGGRRPARNPEARGAARCGVGTHLGRRGVRREPPGAHCGGAGDPGPLGAAHAATAV